MKSYIKGFALFILGMVITILFYPFLHELGHVIAIMIVGIKSSEFHLLPVPYVLCDMSDAGIMEYFVIGFAGVFFPFAVSQLLRLMGRKNVYINFTSFIIEGITVLALVISLVSILCLKYGYIFQEDDVVNLIIRTNVSSQAIGIIFCFLISSVVFVLYLMRKQKTLSSVINYI